MVKRGTLVQPAVVPPRRPSRKAKAVGGSGHRDCAQVASLPVVPTGRGNGLRDRGDASRPEPFLSAAARGTRGGRTLRMERRGFQNPTPARMLLNKKHLKEGRHLQPHQHVPISFKTKEKGRARKRRTALCLPHKKKPVDEVQQLRPTEPIRMGRPRSKGPQIGRAHV